jgi:tetratricopeptide (TPR) repeat protein
MIADRPLSGSGLGTYALIYPFYAKKSLRDQTWATHAESDWLTLTAEAGIPAMLLALFSLGMLCWQIPKLARLSGYEWPLRSAFLAAFFAELLHGLVDVPLHRPELGWWIMLLGGIGFGGAVVVEENRPYPHRTLIALRCQRAIFLASGLAMIVLGSSLLLAEWGRGSAWQPSPFEIHGIRSRLLTLSLKGDPDSLREAIGSCQKAISEHPLQHIFYYQLALLVLQEREDIPRAESLFELERRISPHDPSFVLEQGKVLADRDPKAAAVIWGEALRRRLLLDQLPACIPRAADLLYSMIAEAQGHPALLAQLPTMISSTTTELQMLWYQRPECDPAMIAVALKDRSFMGKLDAHQQDHLIELWFQHHGERSEIEELLAQHPEYAHASSATQASLLAASGQEKEACQLLLKTFHLQIPEISTSMHSAGQDVPGDPLEAARYYLTRGNDLAARRLLAESLQGGGGDREGKDLFLRAILEMRENNWQAAFGTLLEFLHTTHQL